MLAADFKSILGFAQLIHMCTCHSSRYVEMHVVMHQSLTTYGRLQKKVPVPST